MSGPGLTARLREPAGDPEGALVLMHGRGVDEHDLFPLLDLLDPDRRLLGIAPRGPLSLPPGGAHWYVTRRVGYPDRDTFLAVLGALGAWLDGLLDERGLTHGRTVIGGFSQGAVTSYALALGADRPAPAALLALSGFMPAVEGFELEPDGRDGLPVAIGHGAYDPVIPVEFGRDARERLAAAGADVLYRESPMGHSVDPRFVGELQGWIARALAHERP